MSGKSDIIFMEMEIAESEFPGDQRACECCSISRGVVEDESTRRRAKLILSLETPPPCCVFEQSIASKQPILKCLGLESTFGPHNTSSAVVCYQRDSLRPVLTVIFKIDHLRSGLVQFSKNCFRKIEHLIMSTENTYSDLSGIKADTDNPYDSLLRVCEDDPASIQERYEAHRRNRNIQQGERMLSADFKYLDVDQILYKLIHRSEYPNFLDQRNCLVFWARPTQAIKDLINKIQDELRTTAPNLWFMPTDNLHMTVLEITHSLTEPEISSRVEKLKPILEEVTDYSFYHRTRLTRPMISFDASAIALSFVPVTDGKYTYHHLRKELYDLCGSADVLVESRYVVPSAHLTIGRFLDYEDVGDPARGVVDPERIKAWLAKIETINDWLEKEYWNPGNAGLEWMIGQEKGLDCQKGALWYGDGVRIRLGKGF